MAPAWKILWRNLKLCRLFHFMIIFSAFRVVKLFMNILDRLTCTVFFFSELLGEVESSLSYVLPSLSSITCTFHVCNRLLGIYSQGYAKLWSSSTSKNIYATSLCMGLFVRCFWYTNRLKTDSYIYGDKHLYGHEVKLYGNEAQMEHLLSILWELTFSKSLPIWYWPWLQC